MLALSPRIWSVGLATLGTIVSGPTLVGCAAEDSVPQRELVVAAAASLNVPFDLLAADFERANPDVEVAMTYGGSSTLAAGIVAGSPIDVFASANQTTMDFVADSGLAASSPLVFAANRMAVALPQQNRAGIEDLADLSADGVAVAMCQPEVPCGEGAATVMDRAGIELVPATYEPDVSAVLTKVRTDQVDAGFVYASDVVTSGGGVSDIPIPPELNTTTSYPITSLADTTLPELAARFVEFVLSDVGQSILVQSGFLPRSQG